MESTYTIEDCLEMLMGFDSSLGVFDVEPADCNILSSMAKQVTKEVPLTDRQYDLLLEKLSNTYYVAQFAKAGMSPSVFKDSIRRLRHPLREIDRSKYVTLVDEAPKVKRSFLDKQADTIKSSVPWIKIGFPFSKRLITLIDELVSRTNNYTHAQGSRDHYFKFEEHIVYEIVKRFKGKEFEIDEEILDFYEKLEYIKDNERDFLPSIRGQELIGFHPATEEFLLERFGKPSKENIVQYKDRALMFGIHHFDTDLLEAAKLELSGLTVRILGRESTQILINPKEHGLNDVIDSLKQLSRLPILIIVGAEQALEDVKRSYEIVKQFAEPSEVSVLFRLDNDTNADFNDYVKNQGLNSPVNEFTKVVYISKDKLPKPLLKNDWRPDSVIRLGSNRVQSKIDQWIHECDLVVHYDTTPSQWTPHYSSKQRKIERI